MRRIFFVLSLISLLSLCSCQLLYYSAMEKLGKEKRDILVKRIVQSKKDQDETQKQLKTTMQAFQELTGFKGGNLEKAYNKLNKEYEKCKDDSDKLSGRIKSIEQVGGDLFNEWQSEINQMKSPQLKSSSKNLLQQAKQRQAVYLEAMHRTESKVKPVLESFHDQVLFLKHNLDARAIGSLKNTSIQMDSQVNALIRDIEKSKLEADRTIQSLNAAAT